MEMKIEQQKIKQKEREERHIKTVDELRMKFRADMKEQESSH